MFIFPEPNFEFISKLPGTTLRRFYRTIDRLYAALLQPNPYNQLKIMDCDWWYMNNLVEIHMNYKDFIEFLYMRLSNELLYRDFGIAVPEYPNINEGFVNSFDQQVLIPWYVQNEVYNNLCRRYLFEKHKHRYEDVYQYVVPNTPFISKIPYPYKQNSVKYSIKDEYKW